MLLIELPIHNCILKCFSLIFFLNSALFQIWWKLLLENARRCLESTSPANLAANYFLLSNLLAGSSLKSLVSIETTNEGNSTDAIDTLIATSPLVRILSFLTADDQISCSSFASKAGLLECTNALISILGEIMERRPMNEKEIIADGDAPHRDLLDKIASRVS